ncbi:putative dispersed gene family protein 1 (DGF-1), partial [Trypanosoma conorhini]
MRGDGAVSVQCNRVGDTMLHTAADYATHGLASVEIVPCGGCAAALNCFPSLTSSVEGCACQCSPGGAGAACLPPGVPLAKPTGDTRGCLRNVAVTESVTFGGEQATLCFEAVVFSGPITATVDLRLMDAFAEELRVTLRQCLLAGGAQLRIKGLDEHTSQLMPGVLVSMENVTATEGTIVLQGTLPPRSRVLLADAALSATVNGSRYAPVTAGAEGKRYGPVLVLDALRLLSSQLVLTRTTLTCGGDACAALLVERDLALDAASSFYMDNCAMNAHHAVMGFLASQLTVAGGSVFALQHNSWRVKRSERPSDAWWCDGVTVAEGSVLQFAGNKFGPSASVLRTGALTLKRGAWLVQRDNDFRVRTVFLVDRVSMEAGSTWSVLRNNFLRAPGGFSGASMWNYFPTSDSAAVEPTVHVTCNYLAGEPLTSYRRIAMQMDMTNYECGACARPAECFPGNTTTASGDGCDCTCAAGGHGDACLPAEVPKALGPRPPLAVAPAEVPCVHGGTVSALPAPTPGVSGLCFVDVHFTSPLAIDLGEFRPTTQTLNITLLRCRLSGLRLTGNSEYAVHMSVTASTVDDGSVVFDGAFGAGSQLRLADSVVDTVGPFGVSLAAEFGTDSSVLLLRST